MPELPDPFGPFLGMSFVGAVNAFVFAAATRPQNPWTPFVVAQVLLTVVALSLDPPSYRPFWAHLPLVGMMATLISIYVWLWRREERRQDEEATAWRKRQKEHEETMRAIEARYSEAPPAGWRRNPPPVLKGWTRNPPPTLKGWRRR